MTALHESATRTAFPDGPTIFKQFDCDPGFAWVRYKVWAGDWYTEMLGLLGESLGDYDRYIGVEMAVDGAVSSLSGAFDASVALLIYAVEEALETPKQSRILPRNYSWKQLTNSAVNLPPDGRRLWQEMAGDVDEALSGFDRDDPPIGWLAQLRRQRNATAHQMSLPRAWTRDSQTGDFAVSGIAAMAGGDPFKYLQTMCDNTDSLTEHMLRTVHALGYPMPLPPSRRVACQRRAT